MISMKKMTKAQAKEFVDSIDNLTDVAFADLTRDLEKAFITRIILLKNPKNLFP